MTKLKKLTYTSALACALAAVGCGTEQPRNSAGATQPTPTPNAAQTQPQSTRITSPLPDGAFRAALTPSDPPAQMRAGEKQVVAVHVRNASQVAWPADGAPDGKFAVTLRDRWLSADGGKVVNDLDGGASLPHDVAPGGEVDMQLRVTAPKQKGDYVLEFDMVQEQVSFFREKGSTPARVNVRVE
ncbi:MAG TPA: hypothetical protein VFA21_18140 [Pyrinomonadaceae bacterium]|nr:hypothetical protein [Pyrinomonadaceae bacterium]